MIVVVLWRDAAIELEDEVTQEGVQGKKDDAQLLCTVGWMLGVKEGQFVLAVDRDPTHKGAEAKRRHRWVYRIPKELVIEVREMREHRRVRKLPGWQG